MDFEIVRTAMKKCKVFDNFDDFQLGLLAMIATEKRFATGAAIYKQDMEANDTFALVVSGSVNVVRDEDEVVHSLGDGELIGEIGVISPQSKRTCTVKAAEDTGVLEWHFEAVGEKLPDLRQKLKDLAWEHIAQWSM